MNMRTAASVLLLGMLGGCAQQSDISALQNRVNQQEQTIRQLASQLSNVQPAQADTWAQVQSLRQEMATLKGQIDNLNYAASGIVGSYPVFNLQRGSAAHVFANGVMVGRHGDVPIAPT